MRGDGKPFEEGRSGNPAGRPKGARSRATQALEAILDGDAESLLRKVIAIAQSGDATTMRLALDRMMPPRRDRLVSFEFLAIETAADLPRATAALLRAVADGELTPAEAADLGKSIDTGTDRCRLPPGSSRHRLTGSGPRGRPP